MSRVTRRDAELTVSSVTTSYILKILHETATSCPDARERAGPVFPPPPVGEEETQAQRARARRDKATSTAELPVAMRGVRTTRQDSAMQWSCTAPAWIKRAR